MKHLIRQQTEAELLSQYPLQAGVDGWSFRLTETSNGAWLAEGMDLWGRKVACQGSDEELLLNQCAAMAREVQLQVSYAPQAR